VNDDKRGDEYHRGVMIDEVLEYLEPAGGGEILDGTLGAGGHSLALLEAYPGCRVLAVDRDPDAVRVGRERLAPFGARARVLQARFDEAAVAAGLAGPTLSGALLDLGISSHQIDEGQRGFTFREGAPLDMRMEGPGAEGPTAADILNGWEEDRLSRMLRKYGDEPRSRAMARQIVKLRGERPFEKSEDLLAAMGAAYGRPPQAKEKARVFQALRIQVNDELGALERALPAVRDALLPGGVFVVLAYHSLEDRLVKNDFREWSRSCICPPEIPICLCRGEPLGTLLTRSVVKPSAEEVESNPRARSARLRAWRKAA
jgi:16S rRNA (cytosine1402-N4)-methyltransferase